MKNLNGKQKRFLKFLSSEHGGIGWSVRINRIVKSGMYEEDSTKSHSSDSLDCVLRDWTNMVDGDEDAETDIRLYGKPTKYLK